jgi:superfamily II DNA or RNA helicase
MLKENNKQQIMVIAHNKNVLKYIYDAVEHRKIATVGYYVGGMKESALKATEDKQIVICTYMMASEGLDIPTLTTLVMVTPKTDIIQTVGRILRAKHANPIVVDIVDTHQPFQNQWKKRMLFYKKQGYKIVSCDSNNYGKKPLDDWKVLFNPLIKCKPLKETNPYSEEEYDYDSDDDEDEVNDDDIENSSHDSDSIKKSKPSQNKKSNTSIIKSTTGLPGRCLLKIK